MTDMESLSGEEWEEIFGAKNQTPSSTRIPGWVRLLTAITVIAMLVSAAPSALTAIRQIGNISEPEEIRAHALERAEESEYGWLVADVLVTSIADPSIGGSVSSDPPDGVIKIDHRSWDRSALDEVVTHEIGHLLEFAMSGAQSASVVRGGITREAWAECAAVAASERSLDRDGETAEYRCTPTEFEAFSQAVDEVTELCRGWGEPECRSID
ncbi:MAG: hypothetical protein V3V01_05130 [Acidimicrobiales bacterium]